MNKFFITVFQTVRQLLGTVRSGICYLTLNNRDLTDPNSFIGSNNTRVQKNLVSPLLIIISIKPSPFVTKNRYVLGITFFVYISRVYRDFIPNIYLIQIC